MLLKDSPDQKRIEEQYKDLWKNALHSDVESVEKMLYRANLSLMPKRVQWIERLAPFRTHLTWIIPLSVLSTITLLYVAFVWIALLVE